MKDLDKTQQSQEDLYFFPYHYLTVSNDNEFHQAIKDRWGYEYISFLKFTINALLKLDWNSLLDIGCGDGKLLFELNKLNSDKKLTGIDISQRAIKFAKIFNPQAKLICGDITDPQALDEKYDAAVLIDTLEHIPPEELDQFLKSIHDHLKENSFFVITVPSTNVPTATKHYQHFDIQSLYKVLEKHFVIDKFYFINRISIWVKLIERFFDNRFFILNDKRLLKSLYKIYEKYFVLGNKKNTKRICVVCKTKNK